MTIRSWLAATRPLAHANIAPPLLLGQAFAVAQGVRFEVSFAVVAFTFGVLDHLFIVFTNDYADREADALHPSPTPFSGGSRVIQDGRLRPTQVRAAALVAGASLFVFSAVAGWLLGRPWLPGFAGCAIALMVLYSVRPFAMSYRGYGEILQGLGVGVVLPLTGYYAQTGSLGGAPITALAPLVLVGFASNILTALPDTEADRAGQKLSWPVRRTEAKARQDALALLGLALLLVTASDPPLPPLFDAVAAGPAALVLLAAFLLMKGADSVHREACLRFVTLAAGAGGVLHLTWSVALWFAPS